MKVSLVIMAAGLGSRYGGSKQVDGIGPHNEILMEYSIYDALRAGFNKVVFIIKPEMEEMMHRLCGDYLAKKTALDGSPVEVAYAFQDFSSVPDFYQIPAERTKPFGTVELLARIRTALRHTRTDGTSDGLAMTGEYHVGDLCIDYNKHRVFLAGEDTHLTPNEYKIVALLGRHAGQVLTYKSMMKELWGPGVGGDNKLLRVHMANIRRKIEPNPVEPQYIFTEVGVGYRMVEGESERDPGDPEA